MVSYWWLLLTAPILLLLIPVRVQIRLQYPVNDTLLLASEVKLFKILPLKFTLIDPFQKGSWLLGQHQEPDVEDLPKKVDFSKMDYRLLLTRLRIIFSVSRKILKRVFNRINKKRPIEMVQLTLFTAIGFSDPALTGFSTGSIWAFHGVLIKELEKKFVLKSAKKKIEVIPNFQQQQLALNYSFVFDLRISQIFIIISEAVRFIGTLYGLIKGVIK